MVVGGHAWLLGGVHGCRGACMVVGGACMGYNEIRSMSRGYASYWNAFLLPSANEVWGKVIFSQACVIPSVHRGGGLASQYALGRGGWLPSIHWKGEVGFPTCTGKGVGFPACTGGVCIQNWEKRVVRILLEWLSCKRYDYSQTFFL